MQPYAQIQGFCDGLSHAWTMKFIGQRVAGCRTPRVIENWLMANTRENGQRFEA
jgi:hypothetical protein